MKSRKYYVGNNCYLVSRGEREVELLYEPTGKCVRLEWNDGYRYGFPRIGATSAIELQELEKSVIYNNVFSIEYMELGETKPFFVIGFKREGEDNFETITMKKEGDVCQVLEELHKGVFNPRSSPEIKRSEELRIRSASLKEDIRQYGAEIYKDFEQQICKELGSVKYRGAELGVIDTHVVLCIDRNSNWLGEAYKVNVNLETGLIVSIRKEN